MGPYWECGVGNYYFDGIIPFISKYVHNNGTASLRSIGHLYD